MDAEKLLQAVGAVLQLIEVPLGPLGLAIAGNETRFADVQPMFGEELD